MKWPEIKKHSQLSGFIFGFITCFVFLFVLTYWGHSIDEVINQWQTLIAGMIAFIGAWLTVWKMNAIEEDKIFRQSLASRVLISDALSELHIYLKQCFEYIYDEGELPIKSDAINIIKQHIKFADKTTAKNFYAVICFYQIHRSRIEGYEADVAIGKTKENFIPYVLALATCFVEMWDYARGTNEKYEIPNFNKKPIISC